MKKEMNCLDIASLLLSGNHKKVLSLAEAGKVSPQTVRQAISLLPVAEGSLLLFEAAGEETVAHKLARLDCLPADCLNYSVLSCCGKYGSSVAHILAERRTFPVELMEQEILSLENNDGQTVQYILQKNGLYPRTVFEAERLVKRDSESRACAEQYLRNVLGENAEARIRELNESQHQPAFAR